MGAEWAAAIVPAIVAGAAGGVFLVRLGHRDGAREAKTDAAIALLTEIVHDHETRLRAGNL